MTNLEESLADIAKLDDPVEQGRRMIALFEELAAGPWGEIMAQTQAAAQDGPDLPELSAEAEEDIRRELDTIVNRAADEAERLFPPQRRRVGTRRGTRQHI